MAASKQQLISSTETACALGPAPCIVVPPPGPKAADAVARDRRVTSPSNTRSYPLVVHRAAGSVVEDVDGNRFLDFTAGIAVCSTGHCHPAVVRAIEEQAGKLIHMCGSDFYYEPMIALAETLARIAPGPDPKRVLFTNSGAESVEAAIKLSRHHTRRKMIIAFHGAFHGRTMGALSLTASKARQKERFGPLVPMVEHVDYGDLSAITDNLFKRICSPDEVAAIFVEPLLGEGGYVVPPPEFLPGLRELCDRHGILLVLDEIQSGMGRTGRMFCCEHYGVVPDILLLAKGVASGMPLGAVVAREPIMDWPQGAQGSTFGGNPVSCAAALATIELLQNEMIVNAARLEPVALTRLEAIAKQHRCVRAPRGKGLMLAADFVHSETDQPDPALRDRVVEEAFARGLLLLGCGETSIRFTPPLCIDRAQLEKGFDVLAEAVTAAEK
ncbi:MAG TPA: acetyl ornithine aminotransferase family protein [Phycisphaerae bacterium]|nr:acetyl ornithine aminotransferase family protein [Phycisphaerae bacterium]HOB74865.1 acetyl ornithine aminotransferase family protein [Phycisphaerae bacterium]HOJ53727.1 acetyl ornithine aminotransferase family protein [Phycisphaerae bacterium]HOL27951.1 acetyl ornithine aminotransferase family protein [Phycisphaerae bacterium]HPP22213.1 acetyl ornithine aminotransferase family protein [Phycisphaerae bacterium]